MCGKGGKALHESQDSSVLAMHTAAMILNCVSAALLVLCSSNWVAAVLWQGCREKCHML